MSLPNSNSNSSSALRGSLGHEQRQILRGEISDEFGDGECVFIRLAQSGFDDDVKFVAGDNGIVALNKIAALENSQEQAAAKVQDNRLLEYRYSVIPDNGCEIEYLRVSIDVANVDFSQVALKLTWRGERPAKVCIFEHDKAVAIEELQGRTLRQNELFDISQFNGQDVRWYIEVPSHTLSLSISANGHSRGDEAGSISVTADAVFLQKNKVWKSAKRGHIQTGTGRIQPDKVLDIIEMAERTPEPDDGYDDRLASSIREEIEAEKGQGTEDNEPAYSGASLAPYSSSSAYIDVVISQKIELFHGEDVILSTVELFEDKVKDDASYVSASLPEWIFLDQRSGDLMGTVPAQMEDTESVEFSIYAVDGAGNSAKAIIPVECKAQVYPAGADLVDHIFSEGGAVSIPTIGMFMEFGLDVNGLEFTGEGLPEGLSVDQNDGLVKGVLAKGSADNAPYKIVITAGDGADIDSGISMQFLLDVTESEQIACSLGDCGSSEAMKNLYRMNRESERLLAANMVGELNGLADGFSAQVMPLTGNRFPPQDIEYSDVPMVQLFTPDRNLYLKVRDIDEVGALEYSYDIQLADKNELPDWIECSSNGFVSIKCMPEHRYVDLELIQKHANGTMAVFDICVDTFEGSMTPTHRDTETIIERQIRELSAA